MTQFMLFALIIALAIILWRVCSLFAKAKREAGALRSYANKVSKRYDLFNDLLKKKYEGKNIGNYLRTQSVNAVGIYGLGSIGERVIEELHQNGIAIRYIIDKRGELHGGRYDGIPVISSRFAIKYKDTQFLIVTFVEGVDEVRKQMFEYSDNLSIVGIGEIVSAL